DQRIEIVREGEYIAVARTDDENWGLADRSLFPIRQDVLRPLVVSVAGLQPIEVKTSKPEYHERLALWNPDPAGDPIEPPPPDPRADPRQPPPQEPAQPTRIRVFGENDALLADVILGETALRNGSRATFVRKADEDQTWLASGLVSASTEISHWIERDLFRVERNDVLEMTVRRPDGERYTLVRQDPPTDPRLAGRPGANRPSWVLERLPRGREMGDQFTAESVVGALAFASVIDVQPASEPVPLDVEPGSATVVTEDGLELTVTVWHRDAFDPADADSAAPPDPAQTEAIPAAAWVEVKASGEGAEEISTKVEGWRFEVSPSAGRNLLRPLEDLLAEQEEGAEDAADRRPGAPPAQFGPMFEGLQQPRPQQSPNTPSDGSSDGRR
ncbi:MAG: DUF4340 domain-containing protein, partial [Planctomycetota bacterium]